MSCEPVRDFCCARTHAYDYINGEWTCAQTFKDTDTWKFNYKQSVSISLYILGVLDGLLFSSFAGWLKRIRVYIQSVWVCTRTPYLNDCSHHIIDGSRKKEINTKINKWTFGQCWFGVLSFAFNCFFSISLAIASHSHSRKKNTLTKTAQATATTEKKHFK